MSSTNAPQTAGTKRAYEAEDSQLNTGPSDGPTPASPPLNSASATSAFRNVSACNRCRVRKNRCDQRLPACTACEKANVRCVGYDPITKREIPRSYVYFLESRLSYFESLLVANDIHFAPPEAFEGEPKDGTDKILSPGNASVVGHREVRASISTDTGNNINNKDEDEKLERLVSNVGMVSVQGASDHRYLGSTSGISFARVVLAAVKSSVSTSNSERAGVNPSKPLINATSNGSSMRDSYFGLQTKPHFKEAPFPDRELAEKLVNLYFEHANPQIPTLHRTDFMEMFEQTYSANPEERTSRELYFLNIVFAIGAGIIWGSSDVSPEEGEYSAKRPRLSSQQAQPEEYHASAIVHLSTFLSSGSADATGRTGSDLEELQAVLLLAGYALLRPVAPGLWYIVGVAVRLAIDLGLHYEDGSGIDSTQASSMTAGSTFRPINAEERGRRQWMRDLRRRLWWCTYALDRLVSTCVGRPFGITDQVITTGFPSLLEDRYITRNGFTRALSSKEPTYKRVAHHYLRLRLLQSEILQVLQYQQAQQTRAAGQNWNNEFMHTKLPSPFLVQHASFRSWRKDVDQRLWEWKESAPRKEETGVAFSTQFLELNYWQAVIMLYRQSLAVPAPFAGQMSPTEDVSSPSNIMAEEKEDEDLVFLKCAEAGQKTLKLYRQLHRLRLVNYSYLATHHLFMAGISFLYAVWHSAAVRSRLSLDDFDFTVLAATSVLGDLMKKCPPAEACRDALERMSKATVQMCMSSPDLGFGLGEDNKRTSGFTMPSPMQTSMDIDSIQDYQPPQARGIRTKRPPPKFDMNLRDLFPDDVEVGARPSSAFLGLPNQLYSRRQQTSQYRPGQAFRQLAPQLSAGAIDPHVRTAMDMNQRQMSSISYQTSDQQQGMSPPPPQGGMSSQYLSSDQNTYNPDFMSNLPGLEFLNNLTGGRENNQMFRSSTAHSSTQPNPLELPASGQADTGVGDGWTDAGLSIDQDTEPEWGYGSGFGVGVGMGLDFNPQHDWSDGQGFDIFDGFFFGANDAGGNT